MRRGDSNTRLPKLVEKVVDAITNSHADVAVRMVERPTEWTRCVMCGAKWPDHTRDCLDYGEQEWEREAERRDAMDSLEYYR